MCKTLQQILTHSFAPFAVLKMVLNRSCLTTREAAKNGEVITALKIEIHFYFDIKTTFWATFLKLPPHFIANTIFAK